MTHAKHRREVRWQITLPFVIGILLCLALSVLSFFAGSGTASVWADISLIWLIIPALFFALIALIILGGLAYAVYYVIKVLPPAMLKVQVFFTTIYAAVKRASDSAASPFIKAQGFAAGAKALRRQLRK